MSSLVGHEACPRCRKQGRDNHKDNLGVYDDGHLYCFSCGYFKPAPVNLENLRKRMLIPEKIVSVARDCKPLPLDSTDMLSKEAYNWLLKYGLNIQEISPFLWSESQKLLIYPIFIEDQLIAWQGRNFGSYHSRKYLTYGNIQDHLHILNNNKQDPLIICEDIISAIKINRFNFSMPLFGGYLSETTIIRLKQLFFDEIALWLDKDKALDSVKFSMKSRELGVKCGVIISERDPKDYNNESICQFIKTVTS